MQHLGRGPAESRSTRRGRIVGEAVDVEVAEEGPVVLVGTAGAVEHRAAEEGDVARERDRFRPAGDQIRRDLFDRPFDRGVQVSFAVAVGGVERAHRVGDVMAHDAGGPGGFPPMPPRDGGDQVAVPAVGDAGSAAPVAVGDVDAVVLEIAEPAVGGAGAGDQHAAVAAELRREVDAVPGPGQ